LRPTLGAANRADDPQQLAGLHEPSSGGQRVWPPLIAHLLTPGRASKQRQVCKFAQAEGTRRTEQVAASELGMFALPVCICMFCASTTMSQEAFVCLRRVADIVNYRLPVGRLRSIEFQLRLGQSGASLWLRSLRWGGGGGWPRSTGSRAARRARPPFESVKGPSFYRWPPCQRVQLGLLSKRASEFSSRTWFSFARNTPFNVCSRGFVVVAVVGR